MTQRTIASTAAALALLLASGAAAQSVRFTEISEQVGVRVTHDPLGLVSDGSNVQDLYGPGVAIEDFNGDGLLDLFYCNGASGNRLFLNDGNWSFTEMSTEMGMRSSRVANGVAIADINNDGRRDFVLGNFYAEPQLYVKGEVNFGQVADGYGLNPLLPGAMPVLGPQPESMGAAWGDYNEDGFVDLYIANYRDQQDVLYRSDRGNYFNYDASIAVTQEGFGFQGVFFDFDDDGDLDIYVANDFGYNFLFMNRGPEHDYEMVEIAQANGLVVAGEANTSIDPKSMSMGLAIGDYDNDLDLDIYVTNFQLNTLYQNMGPGKTEGFWNFRDVTKFAAFKNIEYPINCWGIDFADLDNDTDLDLIQASGYIWSDSFEQPLENPDQVWLNNGPAASHTFTSITDESGFNSPMMGRGLATGDIDGDGDLDVLVGNNTYHFPGPDQSDRPDYTVHYGDFLLYRNDQDFQNNWVKLRLKGQAGVLPGSVANRSGVGARVWVKSTHNGGIWMMREVQAGASFMSHNSLELEFGLGTGEVDSVKVRWPGQDPGEEEVFMGISHNAAWTLVEGEGAGIRVPVALISFEARNLDRGVMLDWVSAPGIRTSSVELLRAPAERPEDLQVVWAAQVSVGDAGGQAFDPTAVDGERYVYQIRLTSEGGFVTLSSPVEIEVRFGDGPSVRRAVVGQNYPNPFNPSTSIVFELPRSMQARLEIFDLRGRHVRTLYEDLAPAGATTVDWDGRDEDGRFVASGVYTYALVTEDGTSARRMTLVR